MKRIDGILLSISIYLLLYFVVSLILSLKSKFVYIRESAYFYGAFFER
jgi:hypothetical protein